MIPTLSLDILHVQRCILILQARLVLEVSCIVFAPDLVGDTSNGWIGITKVAFSASALGSKTRRESLNGEA